MHIPLCCGPLTGLPAHPGISGAKMRGSMDHSRASGLFSPAQARKNGPQKSGQKNQARKNGLPKPLWQDQPARITPA
jgi:hypothetical protein